MGLQNEETVDNNTIPSFLLLYCLLKFILQLMAFKVWMISENNDNIWCFIIQINFLDFVSLVCGYEVCSNYLN